MSLLKRLKQATPMMAIGATLLTQSVQANESHDDSKTPTPITQQTDTQWHWSNTKDKAVYDSLPKEYKAFANKTFDERIMMQEEWEQKDFLTRKKRRDQMLKKNPTAKIGNLYPGSIMAQRPLSESKVGTFNYGEKILKEYLEGKLTVKQAQLANEMKDYGRPISTVDTSASYSEQLASCGFDVFSHVAAGQKEDNLSPREHSILIAQMQASEKLQFLPENENNRIDLKRRLEQEDIAHHKANHGFLAKLFTVKTRSLKEGEYMPSPTEEINGKTVFIPQPNDLNYSYFDEVTRRVANKIKQEETNTRHAQKLSAIKGY